jgi:hypothetical protein
MDEENVFPIPNLKLQQHLFVLVNSSSDASAVKQKARQTAGTELLKGIEEDGKLGSMCLPRALEADD